LEGENIKNQQGETLTAKEQRNGGSHFQAYSQLQQQEDGGIPQQDSYRAERTCQKKTDLTVFVYSESEQEEYSLILMNILIKFIYISPMRATNRKINRQPVHSPSPDIAAKNKITTTNAPMTEVIKKSRINSLATMGHDLSLEELHRTIIDWEEKYKILERQLNSLLLENSALKKEISQLQSLLAQNKPVFVNPSQQDTETLRDYEGRFARLMEEIRRIQ
jgi:hypothetical protein